MFNSRIFFAVVDQLVQFFNCIIFFIKETFLSVKKYIFCENEITKIFESSKNINKKSQNNNIISHVKIKDLSDSFKEKYALYVNFDDPEVPFKPEYEVGLMHLVMKFMAEWRCESLFQKKLYIGMKLVYYDNEEKSKQTKDEVLTSSTIPVTSSVDNKIYVYKIFNELYLSLKSRGEACSVEIITVGCSAEKLKNAK